jgi:hypothetical protein
MVFARDRWGVIFPYKPLDWKDLPLKNTFITT